MSQRVAILKIGKGYSDVPFIERPSVIHRPYGHPTVPHPHLWRFL